MTEKGTGRLTFPCAPTRSLIATPLALLGTFAGGWVVYVVVHDLLVLEPGGFWTSVVAMGLVLGLLGAGAAVFCLQSRLEITPTAVTYRRPFLLASEPRWSLDVRDLTAIHLDHHRYHGAAHDQTHATFAVRGGGSRAAMTGQGRPIDFDRVLAVVRSGPGAHVQLTQSDRPVTSPPSD